jgi:thymidylate synthase ThyX
MTITAKIIAHSIAPNGQQIVTWELEYQRFIHGEFMTHRLFSRNAASSRAIPVKNIIAAVRRHEAMPLHWGVNQPGMQAKEQLTGLKLSAVKTVWVAAANQAAKFAEELDFHGLHKQTANRILEPFQTMKTVMTATCMDNFFWLRNHEDAQPEIKELARLMWEVLQESTPIQLQPGWWHTPYTEYGYWNPYMEKVDPEKTLANALAISSSCCAQVSYRKLDDTLEKAQMVYKRLVESEPVHASPFEHQASPMAPYKYQHGFAYDFEVNSPALPETWEEGITHADRKGNLWSGNFVNWIQHRQLIPNNVCKEYKNG